MALLASACAPAQVKSDCELVQRRILPFTAADASDVLEARASGPSCDKAVATISLRRADGTPLWAFAAPIDALLEDAAPDAVAMEAFLARWIAPTIDDTGRSPEWAYGAQTPPAEFGARGYTRFVRDTYESIRAAKLTRLCLATGAARQACLFYDPNSADPETGYGGVDVHFVRED